MKTAKTTRDREKAFWNDRYGGGEPGAYGWEQFRHAITPAYVKGGARGGLVHKRAYELLLAQGVKDRKILDYACGLGGLGLHLAQLGADVCGFDFSEEGIAHAAARAQWNGVSNIRFDVADVGSLPYADNTFDAVIGFSALEHVIKYKGGASELRRVMKPSAVAYFTEHYGQNRLIDAARKITMRGQEDAGDVLLTDEMMRSWAGEFFTVSLEGHSLFFMVKRVIKNHVLLRFLYSVDCVLFSLAPSLRRYGGEVVVTLRPK